MVDTFCKNDIIIRCSHLHHFFLKNVIEFNLLKQLVSCHLYALTFETFIKKKKMPTNTSICQVLKINFFTYVQSTFICELAFDKQHIVPEQTCTNVISSMQVYCITNGLLTL